MPGLVVVGRTGQLAVELARAAAARGIEARFLGRHEADLARPDDAVRALKALRPDWVINAAAYTAVDKAESEPDLAMTVNGEAPGALARACARLGAAFVHVSTDYVFSGEAERPWREDDPIAPLSVYGRSKAVGETAVRDSGADALVIRTSWMFSAHGANFVKTMLRVGAERPELRVVDDQHGRPTSAADLAEAALACGERLRADRSLSGVTHFANAGATTWMGFAEAILEEGRTAGLPVQARVTGIPTSDYPTPATRPAWSVLDTSGLEARFGVSPRPWSQALRECVRELAAGRAS